MKFVYSISALCIFLSAAVSNALVYKIAKFQRPDGNTVWCMYDSHPGAGCTDPSLQAVQRNTIVDIARSCNGFVIAEDISNYQGNNQAVKEKLQQYERENNDRNSCLQGMVLACQAQGVRCANVEFRQLMDFSIAGPLAVSFPISANQVLQEIEAACADILAIKEEDDFYQNIKKFNEQVAQQFRKNNKHTFLELKDRGEQPIKEFFDDLQNPVAHEVDEANEQLFQEEIFNEVLLCDALLINGKIAKLLGKHARHEKNIFLCAGGNHIEAIIRLLQEIEYKQVEGASLGGKDTYTKENQIEARCAVDIKNYFQTHPVVELWTANKKQRKEKEDGEVAGASVPARAAAAAGAGAGAAAAAQALCSTQSDEKVDKESKDKNKKEESDQMPPAVRLGARAACAAGANPLVVYAAAMPKPPQQGPAAWSSKSPAAKSAAQAALDAALDQKRVAKRKK